MPSDAVTITLDAPGKNSLSTDLMSRTLGAVKAAEGRPIFLTGAGDTFSAGLNLKEIIALDVPGLTTFLGVLEELVTALYEHRAPTVAYVNGHAIAGGCVLALTCDFRVAANSDKLRIGLNEVAIGLQFPPRTWDMCSRRVPAASFERVVLEAALYDARTAVERGFVDALGDEAFARAKLEELSAHPRAAYSAAKLALRPRLEVVPEVQKRFLEEIVPTWNSPELKARLASMLEKRRS